MNLSDSLTKDQHDATALLATVRHQMTGREIDICETITEGVAIDDEPGLESTSQVFESLKIQFYAQITNWKNSGVAA